MKYSKAGILKKKVGPSSDVLLQESKRMEQRLSELRDFMQKEKEKRDTRTKQGNVWRSGGSTKPLSNYADLVLSYKPKPGVKRDRPAKDPKFIPTSSLIEQPKPNLSKIQSAKSTTKPDNQVFQFLQSCSMEKYYSVFIENGIQELEILMELTEQHLTDLKVPLGHRLKILKKIRESKSQNSPIPSPQPSVQERPVLEPLPYLENNSSEQGVGNTDESDFRQGEFDQAASAQMFREALENFRKSGSETQHKAASKPSSEIKKVRFTEPITAQMLPSTTSNLLYQGSWEPESTTISTVEEGSGPNKQISIVHQKVSCWNCYKIIPKDDVFEADGRAFCGQSCALVFVESNTVKCVCGKDVVRGQGAFYRGNWYCSDECVEQNMEEEDDPLDDEEPVLIKIDPSTGTPIQ